MIRLFRQSHHSFLHGFHEFYHPLLPATLSFQFKVDEAPAPHDVEILEESNDFNNHLGDILSHIIQNAFDTGNYKVGSNDKQSTNDDSAEVSE